jgi:hypothetical protein
VTETQKCGFFAKLAMSWTVVVREFDSPLGLEFCLLHRVQTDSVVHRASRSKGTGGLFSGVKRLVRESNSSPPSSAESRMHGVILPPQYFFMVWCLVNHRENFTLYYRLAIRSHFFHTIILLHMFMSSGIFDFN